MSASEADTAARLIERLLADPGFRATFRDDPATACHHAGLHQLAEEMSIGAGDKAMQTLQIRESRSSLAGVMMAAALEGIGVIGFVEHVVPQVAAVPGAVQDVLSRVNLPAVGGMRGALASEPAAASAGANAGAGVANAGAAGAAGAAGPGAAGAAAAAAPMPAPVAEPAPEPDVAAADEAATDAAATDEAADAAAADEAAADGTAADAAAADAAEDPAGDAAAEDAADDAPADDAAAEPLARSAAVEPPAAPAEPIDPAQYGRFGAGGKPDAEALALLENKNVVLDQDGIADIKEGKIDPRIVAILTKLSEDHKIQVSCMCRDHAVNTTGGSVSNHSYGRGMDIAAVDGAPVNASNLAAREVASELGRLAKSMQADEIGTPWQIDAPGYFTDGAHNDHLHVAFKQLITKDWKPPADVAAGGGEGAVASVAGTAAPGGEPVVRRDTLSLAVSDRLAGITGKASSKGTMGLAAVPAGNAAGQAPLVRAVASGVGGSAAGSADERLAEGAQALAQNAEATSGAAAGGAGPKAAAALKEALKYKGTDYLWGGSSPKTGFDCSGLVQWAYAKQGIQIPRVTDQQILATNGDEVKRADLVPGDLVFFRNESGYVHHVGMSMGGDKFLHAPRTGDVVKESSLKEAHYSKEFAGGRRFDKATGGGGAGAAGDVVATPDPVAVRSALDSSARDAAEVKQPGTMAFQALRKQEASHHNSTMQFMRAVRPDEVKKPFVRAVAAELPTDAPSGPLDYPGDNAPKTEIAAWMGRKAQAAGLPRELPVMAGLVESNMTNVQGGDRDSVGYFQMRVGIWNKGAYAGYPKKPELQLKWFIDTAVAVKEQRLGRGETGFLKDPQKWGEWVADVERCQEDLRYKYQTQLGRARQLLGGGGSRV